MLSADAGLPDDFSCLRMDAGGNASVGYGIKESFVKDGRRFVGGTLPQAPSDVRFGNVSLSAQADAKKLSFWITRVDEGHALTNECPRCTGMVAVPYGPDLLSSYLIPLPKQIEFFLQYNSVDLYRLFYGLLF